MKKSLQQIQEFYEDKGYAGEQLRQALLEDAEYQEMLKERQQNLSKKYVVSSTEQRKYVLPTETDFEILQKSKKLQKLQLTKEDEALVELIQSQLETEWRKHLLEKLNDLLKKYQT